MKRLVAAIAMLTCSPVFLAAADAPPAKSDAGVANRTLTELALELVWVGPGSFQMGRTSGADDDERPVTQVRIAQGFWIGKTEVTQRQYQLLIGVNPSGIKGDTRPVDTVSWDDAVAFCKRLTDRERAAGRLPEGYVYSLPTEAQWEYVCKAGTNGDFAGPSLEVMGWFGVNSGGQTHPVGQKQSNPWGLQDMHGNVWEWCSDWYGNYPGGSVADPTGTTKGPYRVYRGGSWRGFEAYARSSNRSGNLPVYKANDVGFRLALVPLR